MELKSEELLKSEEFLKSEELLKCYTECKNEITSIYSHLEKDKTTTLNLDKVKNFLLEVSKILNDEIKIKDVDINEKILVLSDAEDTKKICFQSGKKIILTKTNFDLTNFNHTELVEILRFLDLTITDNSYDYLRTEIVNQIHSVSNISMCK